MPTYGYECKSCGHSFDAFQRMSDAPLSVCPQCGGALRRLINGGTGVIFKGSGFYVTDKKAANPAAPGTTGAKKDAVPAAAPTPPASGEAAPAPACAGCAPGGPPPASCPKAG